jgi:hypothetical protein
MSVDEQTLGHDGGLSEGRMIKQDLILSYLIYTLISLSGYLRLDPWITFHHHKSNHEAAMKLPACASLALQRITYHGSPRASARSHSTPAR